MRFLRRSAENLRNWLAKIIIGFASHIFFILVKLFVYTQVTA